MIEIFINSLLSSLPLALVALGFSLIFNATKVFHLAHGALYVTSTYAFYYFRNEIFQSDNSLPIAFSLILSFVLICVMIYLIERFIYRHLYLKGVNPTISLISSLGLYLFIVNLISFLFGSESISLKDGYEIIYSTSSFTITFAETLISLVCIFILILVYAYSRTTFYTDLRAISDDYKVAEKFGISIKNTRLQALFIGTVLVGIAGLLRSYELAIDPHSGMTVTLTSAVAVIIGGVKSLKGTFLACIIISFLENFSVLFISAQWKETLIYILLIVVLLFYQKGLISNKQRVEIQ